MYQNVLVPIDPAHGEVGSRVTAVARHLAGRDGRVTLLTVVEPVPAYVANYIPAGMVEANRSEALAQLEALAAGAGDASEISLKEGKPSEAILQEAARLGADAIVLGSHRPDYRDYLIGSTAARVVRHAACTVVVERSADVRP